jgi:hypothetical protein
MGASTVASSQQPVEITDSVEKVSIKPCKENATLFTEVAEGKLVDAIAADTLAAESEYTEEFYKKLRWKIDLWLLPVMWVSISTSIWERHTLI